MNTIRTLHRRLALVLLGAASSAAAQTPRDSAGIRIIDNAKPVWTAGREWRLSDKPIVDIGAGPGADQEFGRLVGATRLSDGRIVVADESSSQLKFYDASGRHLKSVGGKGQGPGEFTELNTITRLAGDSIAADMMRTAAIFAPSGAFVRNVRYGPFPAGALQTPFVIPLGRFDNGTAVVADYPQGRGGPPGAKKWVDSSTLFLVDRAGGVMRPLGKAASAVYVAGPTRPSPLDLGPQLLFASSGRSVYLGFTDQYSIRIYNSDWKLERIVRRAWTPRRLTARDLDEYVDGWMRMWSKATGPARETERKEMRESAYPDVIPPYAAILATPSGEMWVREPDMAPAPGCWCFAGMSTTPSKWSVFDPAGRWLGDVAMPPLTIPLEIGADYVLGRARGADDAPHVVMYRLDKR